MFFFFSLGFLDDFLYFFLGRLVCLPGVLGNFSTLLKPELPLIFSYFWRLKQILVNLSGPKKEYVLFGRLTLISGADSVGFQRLGEGVVLRLRLCRDPQKGCLVVDLEGALLVFLLSLLQKTAFKALRRGSLVSLSCRSRGICHPDEALLSPRPWSFKQGRPALSAFKRSGKISWS